MILAAFSSWGFAGKWGIRGLVVTINLEEEGDISFGQVGKQLRGVLFRGGVIETEIQHLSQYLGANHL